MIFTVATCQFPTSGDISANLDFVLCLLQEAKTQGADVASFPECALSGYAGSDFETNASIDWQGLASAVAQVAAVAASLHLWGNPRLRASADAAAQAAQQPLYHQR